MSRLNLEDEFEPETVNQLLMALSNEYNRGVLNYFRESTETVASLDDLAEYVGENSNGPATSSPERIAVHLHHSGVPKLADAGVLDYDQRNKTVRCRDHPLVEIESVGEFFEVR